MYKHYIILKIRALLKLYLSIKFNNNYFILRYKGSLENLVRIKQFNPYYINT